MCVLAAGESSTKIKVTDWRLRFEACVSLRLAQNRYLLDVIVRWFLSCRRSEDTQGHVDISSQLHHVE